MDNPATLNKALVGRYEVEREIGAGGMATVYLARDVRHGRNVALKLLKPELGAVLGVERFLAEIQVTANLQHPNLLPLFDSGEVDGLLFYVMPFIEGESLRARLLREKQLPVDEAVRIATAIANALAYAHDRGVIHRDLKPENILLQAGQPMIADFGIALAVSNAGGARVTQTGISLGTPQYMSPEQATGDRAIDGRADVYSLGAMLYEMLVGDPPHVASTAQAVIAKVLTDRPQSVRTLRQSVPSHVDAGIQRALEKLPADRWTGAREFADALAGRAASVLSAESRGVASRSMWREPVFLGVAAIAVAASGAAVGLATRSTTTAIAPVVRFTVSRTTAAEPYYSSAWSTVPSPDGRLIVYTAFTPGGVQLYVRAIDQLEGRPLANTEKATQPVFSPDGKWIAFLSNGKLKKIPIEGGTPVTLADASSANGADWSSSHQIVLGAEGEISGLSTLSDAGGKLVPLTKADSAHGGQHVWPVVLADGNTVVFTIWDGKSKAGSRLAITSMKDGTVTNLGLAGIAPLGVFDGQLVYVQADGAVMAAPLDVRARRVTGSAMPVLDPVLVCAQCNGDAAVRIARDGTIAYLRGTLTTRMLWADRNGARRPVRQEAAAYATPRLSPDGTRIAVQITADQPDIWILNLATNTLSRLTTRGSNRYPSWSPDGKSVLFNSDRDGHAGIWREAADGSGSAEKLTDDAELGAELSPDGKTLLFTTFSSTMDIMSKRIGDTQPARAFLATGAFENSPRFSPDGHWVVYESTETGQNEVYVRAADGTGGRVQVSVGGGVEASWSGDGRRIYYRSNHRIDVANVATSPTFAVVSRDSLFQVGSSSTVGGLATSFDVSRDGSRFLLLEAGDAELEVVVATNWIAELKAHVGKR